ncbi:hypothetical protein GCM10018987_56050 [Streptomyces cremeus]
MTGSPWPGEPATDSPRGRCRRCRGVAHRGRRVCGRCREHPVRDEVADEVVGNVVEGAVEGAVRAVLRAIWHGVKAVLRAVSD